MTTYVVDANLIVLLVVGSFDVALLGGRHKRCREFDATDFSLLNSLLAEAKAVVTTPQAMAEASNLVRSIGEPLKSALTVQFGDLIPSFVETYTPSAGAVHDVAFARLGLTDALLLKTARDLDILTTDLDLYLAALGRGQRATNFVHLRETAAPH